jgi:hypothetical protein
MKTDVSVQDLLFGVAQVPVEAVIGTNGHTRRLTIPGKKALINQHTGQVLGVVSREYRVVTNQEAVDLAREACRVAFPGISPLEWEAKRASAPRTLSFAHIDLMHRTHVLNDYDTAVGKDDPFTPFLRVTNSFNGARALRFDIGFMRKHCSNGVIFKEEVATIRASLSKEALDQLKIEITSRTLPQMWDEFSKFLTTVRRFGMTPEQSALALNTVLHLPEAKLSDKPVRQEGLQALAVDLTSRLTSYRQELGPNAYAVLTRSRPALTSPSGQQAVVCLEARPTSRLNTLTGIAARPPENPQFQKTRDTIEKRSGRWLKELARQSQATGFDLNAWIPTWEAGGGGRQIPGSN